MIVLNVFLFLVNFFRTLLIIVIIYYVVRFIGKYVLPFFIGQHQQQQQSHTNRTKRPDGDVRVEKNQHSGSRIPRDEGEYVDFEEID